MVDTTQIQNDISIGEINQPQQQSASLGMYLPPVPTSKIDQVTQSINRSDMLAFPSDVPKYFMTLEFYKYSRSSLMKIGELSGPKGTIILPVPQQIINPLTVLWDQEALGMGVGGVVNGISNIGGAINDLIQGDSSLSDTNNKFLGGLGGTTLATAALAGATLGNATNDIPIVRGVASAARQSVTAAQSLLGLSPNQFVTIVLKGPSYKRLQFSWKLIPHNQKESEVIREICKLIQNKASPTTAVFDLLWRFPHIVKMGFRPNEDYMFKFKPMVIESFVANYTPGGVPAFYKETGAPEGIDITLRVLELEYWLDGDYGTDISSSLPQTSLTPIDPVNRPWNELNFSFDRDKVWDKVTGLFKDPTGKAK